MGRNTTDGFHNDMDELVGSKRHKRHLRLFEQAYVLRSGSDAGSRVQQRDRKMARSLTLSSSEYNLNEKRRREVSRIRGNTQHSYKNSMDEDNKHVNNERDIFLEDLISKKLLASTITSNVGGNGGTRRPTNPNVVIGPRRYTGRLEKRSANGNHQRQAEKLGEKDEDKKGKHSSMSRDGFHHPHVNHGGNGGAGGGIANPTHHRFDSGDGPVLHYGKMEPADSFDPFVFDPDQSFAPILDPSMLIILPDINKTMLFISVLFKFFVSFATKEKVGENIIVYARGSCVHR